MSKELCCKCKKNRAGEYKDISFNHLEMTVKISKDGLTCEKCARETWIENFEENAKEFILILYGGKAAVNWPSYHKHFTEGRFPDQKEKFHGILIDLGILSLQPEGNWEIVADGPVGLNPRAYLSYLYFINKEDAIEFAKLQFPNTLYRWGIHLISQVIEKEEVLKGLKR